MSTNKDIQDDYFIRKGKQEVMLLRKHFHITGKGDEVQISHEIKPSDIKNFFKEYMAEVRPSNLQIEKILPKPDITKLRGLYVGEYDANVLLNLIVRHSLYVDQILLADPFQDYLKTFYPYLPFHKSEEIPRTILQSPELYIADSANHALCLCALQSWIEQGIILLIPNLFYYHPEQLRIPTNFILPKTHEQEEKDDFYKNLLLRENPEIRNKMIDLLVEMGHDISEVKRLELLRATQSYEQENPIRFRLPIEYYKKYGGYTISMLGGGIPLMSAGWIAEETGSFLMMEHEYDYETLCANLPQKNNSSDSFQQLSLAFQTLDFPFLHNVSSTKALELRNKKYLFPFRTYLRELWHTVTTLNDQVSLDKKIIEFRERLILEYAQLEEDWKRINNEFFTSAALTGLSTGLTIIAHGSIALGVVGIMANGVVGYSGYRNASNDLRKTERKPLAVLIKLAH